MRTRCLWLLPLLAACREPVTPAIADTETPDTTTVISMAPAVRAYLDSLVSIMENNSVRRLVIDWTNFRQQVIGTAPSAQTLREAHPAIQRAIVLLGDHHSSYRAAGGQFFADYPSCTAATPPVEQLSPGIAYTRIPAFSGTSQAGTDYASSVQNAIRVRDDSTLRGWIVDLRGNTGGNMWPMIAGLGPLLLSDTVGYFVGPEGDTTPWGYRDGAAWLAEADLQAVPDPYVARFPDVKVAVLIDGRVASSGEMVAAAFRGRPNTRFFGSSTCGLSTANRGYAMPDGAVLLLAVAVVADRARTSYALGLDPDDATLPGQTVSAAIDWITAP